MRALGRAAKVPAFQAGEVGSIPTGHLFSEAATTSGDRLTASLLPLKQVMRVQLLLPELRGDQVRQRVHTIRGSCCW